MEWHCVFLSLLSLGLLFWDWCQYCSCESKISCVFDCTEFTKFPSLLCLYNFQVDSRFIHLFLSKGQPAFNIWICFFNSLLQIDWLTGWLVGLSHFHFYIFTKCVVQSLEKLDLYFDTLLFWKLITFFFSYA